MANRAAVYSANHYIQVTTAGADIDLRTATGSPTHGTGADVPRGSLCRRLQVVGGSGSLVVNRADGVLVELSPAAVYGDIFDIQAASIDSTSDTGLIILVHY